MTKIDEMFTAAVNHRENLHDQCEVSVHWRGFLMIGFFLEAIFRQLKNIEIEIISLKGRMK